MPVFSHRGAPPNYDPTKGTPIPEFCWIDGVLHQQWIVDDGNVWNLGFVIEWRPIPAINNGQAAAPPHCRTISTGPYI